MSRRSPRSTVKFEARRTERRFGLGPAGAERATIAQAAARLIAEHGITDWSLAKRKAARQLDLPERAALPGDDEIQSALHDYHALFGGEAHADSLRAQREEALLWMNRLGAYRPLLVGAVAEGWVPSTATPPPSDREILSRRETFSTPYATSRVAPRQSKARRPMWTPKRGLGSLSDPQAGALPRRRPSGQQSSG